MKFVDSAPLAGGNGSNGSGNGDTVAGTRTTPASDTRLSSDAKTFVLDTNVLLHNPNAIFLMSSKNWTNSKPATTTWAATRVR
jgi:hypothetical protein